MFRGRYFHTIDEKGRVILPAAYKKILKEKKINKVVITCGEDKCLQVYPWDNWLKTEQKIKNILENMVDVPSKIEDICTKVEDASINIQQMLEVRKKIRNFALKFFSDAQECKVDNQGRFKIPQELLQIAELSKEIVIVGFLERIEIWDKDIWTKHYTSISKTHEKNGQILGFGI
jgi:MraZ protein